MDLFYNPEELTEEWLLNENLITSEQAKRFHQYEKNRLDDQVENVEYIFDQMSPLEQKDFIKKLQKSIQNKQKIQ